MAEIKRPLEARELAVLLDVAAGLTARSSARSRDLTEDAVKGVRQQVYRVLGALNGAHAVAIAAKEGLI